jgi:hypothetical protein
MWGIKGFIGIGGYKKGYKNMGSFLLERCIESGVQQRDFGRYFSISSEIGGIL